MIFCSATKFQFPKLDHQKFIMQFQRLLMNPNIMQLKLASAKCNNKIPRNENKFWTTPKKIVAICCRRYCDFLVDNKQAILGVKIMRNLIKSIRDSSESLTPIHPLFIQLCLVSKCYNYALETLSEEIYDVNPEKTGVGYRDLLLYYYYGGLVYTGLKKFKQALQFFLMVKKRKKKIAFNSNVLLFQFKFFHSNLSSLFKF